MTRITEKGIAHYLDRIFEIESKTNSEIVEVLCIIASCMLHDLNKVNIKLTTTEADFIGYERRRTNQSEQDGGGEAVAQE